jgi:IclR family KDG regulon transcriptional repressor
VALTTTPRLTDFHLPGAAMGGWIAVSSAIRVFEKVGENFIIHLRCIDKTRPVTLVCRFAIHRNVMKRTQVSRKGPYDKRFVGVTQKDFMLLEALSQQRKAGVSLEEVTKMTGMPKTSVHRLLYTMEKLGYVDQDPATALFSLSGKFFELGKNALPYQRLTVMAKPLMQRLLLTFGESVNLAVPQDDTLLYIMVLESPKPFRMAAYVGQIAPLHCTSVGKCIAAYLSREELERQLTLRGMPTITPKTITSQQQFEQELSKVRAEGVAVDNEEGAHGIICVGGPIFAHAKEPIAALSVTGPSIRMAENLSAIKETVREVVYTISSLLGARKSEQ